MPKAPDGAGRQALVPRTRRRNFLARGGKVITASRDAGMGFIFTSLSENP